MAAFVAFGMFWGAFSAATADLKRAFDLSDAALGLFVSSFVIAGAPAAALAARPIARFGARRVGVACGLATAAAGCTLAALHQAALLPVGTLFVGAATSTLDVALNAQAVETEAATGGRVIGRLHSMFFSGAVAGGAVIAAVHALHVSWRLGLAGAALCSLGSAALMAAWPAGYRLEPPPAGRPRLSLTQALRRPVVRRMALLVLIGFSLEGGVNNWSSVYLRDSLGVAAVLASLAVSGQFMLNAAGSAGSDLLARRLGADRVFAIGGGLTVLAIGLATATRAPVAAVFGLWVASFALALIAPTAFSRAGADSPQDAAGVVAALTVIGYLAFLVGPILMGALAGLAGLRGAIACLGLLGLAGVAVGWPRGRRMHRSQPAAIGELPDPD
jgi:MFS family permease